MNYCPKCKNNTAKPSYSYPEILVCYCGGSVLNEVGSINSPTPTPNQNFIQEMSQKYIQELQATISQDQFNYCVSQYQSSVDPAHADHAICWEGEFIGHNELLAHVLQKFAGVEDFDSLPKDIVNFYKNNGESYKKDWDLSIKIMNDIFNQVRVDLANY